MVSVQTRRTGPEIVRAIHFYAREKHLTLVRCGQASALAKRTSGSLSVDFVWVFYDLSGSYKVTFDIQPNEAFVAYIVAAVIPLGFLFFLAPWIGGVFSVCYLAFLGWGKFLYTQLERDFVSILAKSAEELRVDDAQQPDHADRPSRAESAVDAEMAVWIIGLLIVLLALLWKLIDIARIIARYP